MFLPIADLKYQRPLYTIINVQLSKCHLPSQTPPKQTLYHPDTAKESSRLVSHHHLSYLENVTGAVVFTVIGNAPSGRELEAWFQYSP